MSRFLYVTILFGLALHSAPAAAQGFGNPFAGGTAGGLGPYGNATGATMHLVQAAPLAKVGATAAALSAGEASKEPPHQAELREGAGILEAMFVGCAAGSFLGGYTAWSTAVPAVGAELAMAAGAPGLAAAAAVGCGLGAATATVTVVAGSLWSWMFR